MIYDDLTKAVSKCPMGKKDFFQIHLNGSVSLSEMILIRDILVELREKNDDNARILDNIQLYVIFPFCIDNKCSYCRYSTSIVHSPDDEMILDYLKKIMQYIDLMFPALKGVKLKSLYIGGGTPSLMSEIQIDSLLKKIISNFEFQSDAYKTFENSPQMCTKTKVDIYKKWGINVLNFGIQSLNPDVMRANKMAEVSLEKICDIVSYARRSGISRIGLDMMAGIEGQTEKYLIDDFLRLSKTDASFIRLYMRTYNNLDDEHIEHAREFLEKKYEISKKQVYGVCKVARENGIMFFSQQTADSTMIKTESGKSLIKIVHMKDFVQRTGDDSFGSPERSLKDRMSVQHIFITDRSKYAVSNA